MWPPACRPSVAGRGTPPITGGCWASRHRRRTRNDVPLLRLARNVTMGLPARWLDRFDPDRLRRALRRLARDPPGRSPRGLDRG
ncbi:MAG TPA: hypothetical protein VFM39_06430, partial [bacterium]|nr:hypothetical protein [bacterium]